MKLTQTHQKSQDTHTHTPNMRNNTKESEEEGGAVATSPLSRKRRRTEKTSSHVGLGRFLTQAFNGTVIRQRPSDGFIDATAMCKVKKGKKMSHWNENKTTHAFICALSDSLSTAGYPALELVEVVRCTLTSLYLYFVLRTRLRLKPTKKKCKN